MMTCSQCLKKIAECEELRARAEIAEEKLRQIRDGLTRECDVLMANFPLRLTHSQRIMLQQLYRYDVCLRARAKSALYAGRMLDGEPSDKIIDVFLNQLKRRLKKHGVCLDVETIHKAGWKLTPQSRAQLRDLIESSGVAE